MKSIILFAVVCVLLQDSSALYTCRGPFEVYQRCGNPCRSTCANVFARPAVCPSTCVPGCYCRPGYLRDHLGACVPVSSCVFDSYGHPHRSLAAHHVSPYAGAYGPHSFTFNCGPPRSAYGPTHVSFYGPHPAGYYY